MNSTQAAMKHYHSHFNNKAYQAIGLHLAHDLRAERESLRVSEAMNLLTDAALSVCGHPDYPESCLKLAIFCGQNSVSVTTIDRMTNYLRRFQIKYDTRLEDFEATANALLRGYAGFDALHSAATAANGIHTWQGRVAYDLLVAAEYLTQTAINLLMQSNMSYIYEKLQSAFQRIQGALHEGVRHADKPHYFDFHTVDFPESDAGDSK